MSQALPRAIDGHLHIQPWRMLRPQARELLARGHGDLGWILRLMEDPEALLAHLDREGVERAALVNYVSPDIMGFTEEVNEFVAGYCKGHRDRLVPVGSVHPRLCRDPAGEVDRLVDELEIRVLKLHPPHQGVAPNEYRQGLRPLEALYRQASERGVTIIIHTGTSIFPGARARYGDPLLVDDVAVDFPDLTLILAHGGRPLWSEEAFFLVRRHPRVFLDISGIPPQRLLHYFPRLEEIASKTLFGTDWPGPGVPGIGENVRRTAALPLSEGARTAILRGTAERLFTALEA